MLRNAPFRHRDSTGVKLEPVNEQNTTLKLLSAEQLVKYMVGGNNRS